MVTTSHGVVGSHDVVASSKVVASRVGVGSLVPWLACGWVIASRSSVAAVSRSFDDVVGVGTTTTITGFADCINRLEPIIGQVLVVKGAVDSRKRPFRAFWPCRPFRLFWPFRPFWPF